MKLAVTKLTYDLPVILIVLLLGGFFLYYSIENLFERNVNEVLLLRKAYAVKLIDHHKEGELLNQEFANVYKLTQEEKSAYINKDNFKDTLIYASDQRESLLYRQLSAHYCKQNLCYHILIRVPIVDYNLILKTILTTIFLISILMAAVLLGISSFISRKIWYPFYATLKNISIFNLDGSSNFKAEKTSISEFNTLNKTLIEITSRLQKEYDGLKEFTSNLTHELQTPIAVIKAQIDVLLQDGNINEAQLKRILIIKNTIETISRFEDMLILLKRIDMGEFAGVESVDFSSLLKEKFAEMDELINLREINLSLFIQDHVQLEIHRQLADVLFNNLVSNAIRHNKRGGNIKIELHSDFLRIENTVKEAQQVSSHVPFLRNKGLGMGLSVIKSICQKYKFTYSSYMQGEFNYVTDIYFN